MPDAILVVEDDRELRDVVRRYLERAGYLVHTTGSGSGSGADALGPLDTGGLDLVVPGRVSSRYELVNRVRLTAAMGP